MALLFASWGWGIEAVWWAISLSSILKGLVMLGFYLWQRQQHIRQAAAQLEGL